jgi:hypothetical protein
MQLFTNGHPETWKCKSKIYVFEWNSNSTKSAYSKTLSQSNCCGVFKWLSRTKAKPRFQAKNGKTELSLIHFSHTNPRWKMPREAVDFMDKIREQVTSEVTTSATTATTVDNEQSLSKSLYQLQSIIYNSSLQSNLTCRLCFDTSKITQKNFLISIVHSQATNQMTSTLSPLHSLSNDPNQKPKGALSKLEGPLFTSKYERQTLLAL